MENIVSGTTGVIHLIVSIIALITGMYVLIARKGTKTHKQIGYVYAVSMALLNVTAFMIYKLYGKFGIFHWFAVFSCLTLVVGLYPVMAKKGKNYLLTHFNIMYWSVVGLYSALMAEIFSRLPKIILIETGKSIPAFYKGVGIGMGVVLVIATIFYIKYQPKWTKQYEKK